MALAATCVLGGALLGLVLWPWLLWVGAGMAFLALPLVLRSRTRRVRAALDVVDSQLWSLYQRLRLAR